MLISAIQLGHIHSARRLRAGLGTRDNNRFPKSQYYGVDSNLLVGLPDSALSKLI